MLGSKAANACREVDSTTANYSRFFAFEGSFSYL